MKTTILFLLISLGGFAQQLKLEIAFDQYTEVCTDPENVSSIIYQGTAHDTGIFTHVFTELDTLFVATPERYMIIARPSPYRKVTHQMIFEYIDYIFEPFDPSIVTF